MLPGKSECDSDRYESSIATQDNIDELEVMVNLAYRGGKATVAWKNEDHLVAGPRIVRADLEKNLADPDSAIIVISKPGAGIVACVHVEKHAAEAHIGMLSVHPEHQNCGLGKRLLMLAAGYAQKQFNCDTAKMFVFGGRHELLSWYQKMGYEPTGETMPFFGPESGLTPLVDDAHFVVIAKNLS